MLVKVDRRLANLWTSVPAGIIKVRETVCVCCFDYIDRANGLTNDKTISVFWCVHVFLEFA